MVTAAFLIVILFLGGWHFWGLTGAGNEVGWGVAILRVGVLFAKILGVILFFMLVRWSWPRFRFDQLMALAWKVMLPLGMVNLVTMAVVVEVRAMYGTGGSLSGWGELLLVAAAWVVMLVAWLLVALGAPLLSDNRPRLPELDRPAPAGGLREG
jgi:NADH-quinone oxidoreductase subunit H